MYMCVYIYVCVCVCVYYSSDSEQSRIIFFNKVWKPTKVLKGEII